ncbi:MAG: hypothetical protein WD717_08080 [Nitrosarchaeum sp.]
MSESDMRLHDRIIHQYTQNSNIEKYVQIKTRDLPNFEPIPYTVSLKLTDLPRDDGLIDDLASHIGRELTNQEFHHFALSLNAVTDNTTETKLEDLPETLDRVYNDLWDEGYDVDLFFVPFSLNHEIRKQKNVAFANITGFLSNPTYARELGQNQIFLACKNNFVKIYPETYEKIDVIVNRMYHHANHAEINCTINQKLEIINRPTIARILVTDVDNT